MAIEDLVSDTALHHSTLELSGLAWQSSSSDSASTVGEMGSILGWGTKISYAMYCVAKQEKKKKIKQNP